MIQPNELRIGNWYKWSEYASMGIGYDFIKNGLDIDRYNELRDPIHLTDELFEKLGFELFESGKKYWCHGSYMFVKGEKGYDVIFDINWDEIAEPIEYVHQLQNLIFCLTGAEISIIL